MTIPLVFPALALITGVAFGALEPAYRAAALAGAFLGWGVAVAAWARGGSLLLLPTALTAFACVGVALGSTSALQSADTPLGAFLADYQARPGGPDWPIVVEGRLRADGIPTGYGASLLVDVERIRTPCGWLPAAGGARLAVTGAQAATELRAWRAGRRVRMPASLREPTIYRNPGVADGRLSLTRRRIAVVGSVKSSALVEVVARGGLLDETAAGIRVWTRDVLGRAIAARPMGAAIVTAILIGDRGGLTPEVDRRLQEAGTYHVIAISGGNIAILAGLVYLLLRATRIPARAGAVVLALLLSGYGYVAGGGPSVARATLAAVVYLLARAADHRTPSLNVLAVVALLAVVHEPLEVFDPGLALSYGATVALLIGGERVLQSRRERREGRERRGAEGGAEGGSNRRTGGRLRALRLRALRLRALRLRALRLRALRLRALRLRALRLRALRLRALRLRALRLRASALSAFSALSTLFFATLFAEAALFPVAAFVFHRITVAGLALNFVAIPLMTMAQVGGLATLALMPISEPAGRAAGGIACWAAEGLVWSAQLVEAAPWLAWRTPAPAWWLMAAYYGAWMAWLSAARHARLRRAAAAVLITTTAWMVSPVAPPSLAAIPVGGDLRVTFLDVGQGDAVLVRFPGGAAMLVDAAGLPGTAFDVGERVLVPALLAAGVRRLDYLAITHGDPDHLGGAMTVARDFRPREIWEGVVVPPHAGLRALRELGASRGAAARVVRADDRLAIAGVEVRVLHPPEPDWERQRVRNDDSIVLEIRYGDVSIVLPGDIGAEVERAVAARLSDAPVRVLKAAHHGSATSSDERWLDAARPAAVIVSCGRQNRFGHPAPAVLRRIDAIGAQVFRTDEDGAITVTTDGRQLAITTFTGRGLRLNHQGHEVH